MVDETVEENTATESDDFRIPETWTELCENEPLFSLLPPLAPAERLSFKQAAQLQTGQHGRFHAQRRHQRPRSQVLGRRRGEDRRAYGVRRHGFGLGQVADSEAGQG